VTAVWLTIAALALATAAIRAAGPVLLGGRELHPRLISVVALLAPTLLAALVVTQTLGTEDGLDVDARLAGVGAAGVTIAARGSALLAVLAAAAVTALVRALS
jgi:branched-subunit amino acid transport protein